MCPDSRPRIWSLFGTSKKPLWPLKRSSLAFASIWRLISEWLHLYLRLVWNLERSSGGPEPRALAELLPDCPRNSPMKLWNLYYNCSAWKKVTQLGMVDACLWRNWQGEVYYCPRDWMKWSMWCWKLWFMMKDEVVFPLVLMSGMPLVMFVCVLLFVSLSFCVLSDCLFYMFILCIVVVCCAGVF